MSSAALTLSSLHSPLLVQFNGKTLLWQGDRPMPLGHPFRFILERIATGVRIRDLVRASFIEVKTQELDRSTSLVLPNSNARLSLRYATKKNSVIDALEARSRSTSSEKAGEWTVFERRGAVVTHSEKMGFPFEAKAFGKSLFKIEKVGSQWSLSPQTEGLTLHSPGTRETQSFQPGNRYELAIERSSMFFVKFGNSSWVFSQVAAPKIASQDTLELADQIENARFKKSLKTALSGLLSLLVVSVIWPKPDKKEEPLIPPQFTKIVMMKQSASSAPKQEQAMPAQAEAAPATKADKSPTTQAKNAKVVQAFRAKALQNAVKGLLKGGMTTLIAQGNLLAGTSVGQARAMLNSKAEGGITSAPIVGLNGAKSVTVASIGNTGSGNGKGVGYGKGEAGKVSGQGKGFVSLDLGNSSVEEGLTKDEVGRVIHAHMSEIRYCYESTMLASPDLEGKLVLDFTIGSQGLVKVTSVRESSLRDPRLDDCVVRRLTKWQFPKPKGGVDVAVTYPFIFKTLGR